MTESQQDWALTRMRARVDATLAMNLSGFPHYADPDSGQWTTSPDAFWTGGFWVGELWLAAHYWKDQRYRAAAEDWTRRLEPRIDSATVFRGFLFYYGAVLGARLQGNAVAKDIASRAARSVARAFNPSLGLIPLGVAAEEAHTVGDNDANIDGLITSPLLLWAAQETGDNELRRIALANADKHAQVFIQADNSVIQSATLDGKTGGVERLYTHKGSAPNSIWTRAQAWAMVNFSLCAMLAPQETRLLETAERVAQWWIDHVPSDHVAYWDFSVEKTATTRRDTSGTAIATSALLRIASLTPDREKAARYRAAAEATARALVERHLRATGLLADGCFDPKNNTALANELIWGSYYLFESLGVLSGKLKPKTV